MNLWFGSAATVDAILVILGLEVLSLALWRRWRARPARPAGLVLAALPGVFLLLALRAILSGAGWPWMALFLALSFPAHLIDLWRRPP